MLNTYLIFKKKPPELQNRRPKLKTNEYNKEKIR